MCRKKKVLFAAGCLAAGMLGAAVVSHTETVNFISGQDATVPLSKFDASLGTLTGIQLEFTVALYGTAFEFDNDNAAEKNVQADFEGYVSSFSMSARWDLIDTLGGEIYVADTVNFMLAVSSGDPTGGFNATGASDYYQWDVGTLTDTFSGEVSSGYFSDYTGAGSFDSTLNFVNAVSHSPAYKVYRRNTAPTGELTASVTYTYAAVPEPAAIGLIATGGIVTLVASRMLRRK